MGRAGRLDVADEFVHQFVDVVPARQLVAARRVRGQAEDEGGGARPAKHRRRVDRIIERAARVEYTRGPPAGRLEEALRDAPDPRANEAKARGRAEADGDERGRPPREALRVLAHEALDRLRMMLVVDGADHDDGRILVER